MEAISYDSEDTSYSLEYDPLHQLTRVVDNSGDEWSYDYDEGNRLVGQAEKINSSVGTHTIDREYDAVSNLVGIKAGADSTVGFSYNQRDDLTAIDLPGGTVDEITFSYDKARKRTKARTPGVISSVRYDQASRVTKMINETQLNMQTFIYDYDSNGNITAVSDRATSGTVNDTRYGYDGLNRLTDWYNSLTDTTTTYQYDKVGNLLEVKEGNSVTKAFSYNSANQISSPGYLYDNNGNMTGDVDSRYVYDAENRLKQVISNATSTTIASYEYDFMGRRISSTDSSGLTTYFHYDGWNVMAESDSSGTITANYYYDTNGQVQAMKKAGQTYYYQFNAHGDVVSLTDSSGSVVNSYTYDPWGSHLTRSETVSNPFRYAGYRFDEEAGLYYLRRRFYNPELKRFITKDKYRGYIGDPKSLNLYVYVQNNPTKWIDQSGLARSRDAIMFQVTGTAGVFGQGYSVDFDIIFNWRSGELSLGYGRVSDPWRDNGELGGFWFPADFGASADIILVSNLSKNKLLEKGLTRTAGFSIGPLDIHGFDSFDQEGPMGAGAGINRSYPPLNAYYTENETDVFWTKDFW